MKVEIRFINNSEPLEAELDIKGFRTDYETEEEIFGWFGDIYIAIKKDLILKDALTKISN